MVLPILMKSLRRTRASISHADAGPARLTRSCMSERNDGVALKLCWKRGRSSGAKIATIATDRSQTFIKVVHANRPEAALVFDRLRVMKRFNDRLSDLRREMFRDAADKLDQTYVTSRAASVGPLGRHGRDCCATSLPVVRPARRQAERRRIRSGSVGRSSVSAALGQAQQVASHLRSSRGRETEIRTGKRAPLPLRYDNSGQSSQCERVLREPSDWGSGNQPERASIRFLRQEPGLAPCGQFGQPLFLAVPKH